MSSAATAQIDQLRQANQYKTSNTIHLTRGRNVVAAAGVSFQGLASGRIEKWPKRRKSQDLAASSVHQRVSKEEWEMRCDLAAAYQLAALFKWTDLIYKHFSARCPAPSTC